jgi:serine/threonine-protein kinase SRPK3
MSTQSYHEEYSYSESDELSPSSDENVQSETENFTGKILNKKYKIVCKIGEGAYSSVWLSYNIKKKKFNAIKIQFEEDFNDGQREVKILSQIGKIKSDYLPQLYDNFIYKSRSDGRYRKRICSVLNLMGEDLYHYCKDRELIPIPLVKSIIKQTLSGLYHIHKQGIIHTDLKPENILFDNPTNKMLAIIKKVKDNKIEKRKMLEDLDEIYTEDIENDNRYIRITDFGTACYKDDIITDEIQTRYYRSPEVIFEYPYSENTDVWSVGCIFFELLTNELLFDPKKDKDFSTDHHHVAMIRQLLGPFPLCFERSNRYRDLFDKDRLKLYYEIEISLKKRLNRSDIPKEELEDILYLLKKMLTINPNKRFSSRECLRHRWFQKKK